MQPDVAVAHARLGVTLEAQGKLDEAIAEFREAIRLRPDDAHVHTRLGVALEAQGNAFRKALDLASPGSALARLIERALAESDD